MNKKRAVTLVSICLLLVVFSVGLFAYGNIKDKPAVSVPQTSNQIQPQEGKLPETQIFAAGKFTDTDAVHKGSGTAEIIKTSSGSKLTFTDFNTTIGPDLYVYLSPNKPNEPLGEFASLGKLKSNTGSQSYDLPENYENYKTVVVWCRAFGVTFTTAELLYE